MGIDVAGLVSMARHGMFKAGLIPHELHEVAKRAAETGSPLGITPDKFEDRVEWMADEHDVEIPVDEEEADVLAVMSSIEIQKYPQSIAATAKILNAAGEKWTFRLDGFCSLAATSPGYARTRPFTWSASRLAVSPPR